VTLLGGALTTETTLTNNPESAQADTLLNERLGDSGDTVAETVIVRSTTLTVDDPAYRSYVEGLYGSLMALGDGLVAGGSHYYLTGDEALVSADRQTTLIPLSIPDDAREKIDQVHEVVGGAGVDQSFDVLFTGMATLDAEITKVAEEDLATGEAIGVSVALVVLALVIGAAAAAFLPLVLAVAAIVVALGATALLGQLLTVPFFVTNIVTMLGLAVGVD
jgi:RND superfamily putative drug exporter